MSEHTPLIDQQEDDGHQSIFPFFKKWSQVYLFVMVELAAIIVFLYMFSQKFS